MWDPRAWLRDRGVPRVRVRAPGRLQLQAPRVLPQLLRPKNERHGRTLGGLGAAARCPGETVGVLAAVAASKRARLRQPAVQRGHDGLCDRAYPGSWACRWAPEPSPRSRRYAEPPPPCTLRRARKVQPGAERGLDSQPTPPTIPTGAWPRPHQPRRGPPRPVTLPAAHTLLQSCLSCAPAQTGKVLKVKVLTSKGVATRDDPESCAVPGNRHCEALTGERAGRVWSRESKSAPGRRPSRTMGKATSTGAPSRASGEPCAVTDLVHARTHLVREPGGPTSARGGMAGRIGKSEDASR